MSINLNLNDMGTLIGVIAGTAGTVLGVLNYLRDRSKIMVELQWDTTAMNLPAYDPNIPWGVIRITNVGRRPTYISHVAIKLPVGYGATHLLIMEGLQGQKVGEGAPPLIFPVKQEGLKRFSKDWKKLRAQVIDSTGKVWKSPRRSIGDQPSWAKIKVRS